MRERLQHYIDGKWVDSDAGDASDEKGKGLSKDAAAYLGKGPRPIRDIVFRRAIRPASE